MEERESIHKGFKVFIIVFTVIILLFINRERIIDIFQGQNADLDLVDRIEDDYDYRFFNGEILRYNENGLAHMEDFDKVIIQKDFGFSEPLMRFGKNNVYYCDAATGDIYVLNNELETISQFNLGMSIFNIYESNKYIMVHSKEDPEHLYSINREGNIIYKNSPGKSILSYDMGANTYAFSTLLIEDDIVSTLHLYNFEGELVDTIDFENEVIFQFNYSGDDLILLTDKGMYMINREILWEKEFSLIKNILLYNENIYLLYSNYLEIFNLSGESLDIIELEEDYDMMIKVEDNIILYGEKEILIIRDEENYKLGIDDIIKSVSSNGNQLIVNTDDYTNIYEFKTREK